MAEILPSPSEKPHKKHKIKDAAIDAASKTERKKKKRKLEDLAEQPSILPSPPISDQSPTTPAAPTSTAAISASTSRTLKTAAVSSPYALTTASRYLSISPAYSATPHIGIQRDHLDPLVFKYDPTLDGVVLLHRNLRFQSSAARILGESPFAFVWCLVEFMLWKPEVGMVLEGWVNNVSPSHVGMLYGNVFSVAVGVRGIPEGWRFVASGEKEEKEEDGGEGKKKKGKKTGLELIEGLTKGMGRWVNLEGNEVEGMQKFVVTAVKAEGGMLSLEGSFKDEDLPELIDDEYSAETAVREVTQIHGKDSDNDEEQSRIRKKEKKEKKKRKREGKADK
ncbi:hypothetical protein ABW19_dt0200750 [Dactylella cylindrospora]|nr:hypothetical protein ABW19_dt0200750 [Dactylella cylindrospora]